MANGAIGDVALTVGGATYTLRLDFNALCEIDAACGRPVEAIFAGPTLSELRAIVWAALRRHHPQVTLAEAGDLIGQDGEAVSAALAASMAAAMPGEVAPAGKPAVGRRRR